MTCMPPGVNVTAVPAPSGTPDVISCMPTAPLARVTASCNSV